MSESLDSIRQSDHVIRIDSHGVVHDDVTGVWAPEVAVETDEDGSVLPEHEQDVIDYVKSQGWDLLTGWSYQDSGKYNGPFMHRSEYIGGGLEKHIRETPGFWVVCGLSMMDDSEPDGWVLAHRDA